MKVYIPISSRVIRVPQEDLLDHDGGGELVSKGRPGVAALGQPVVGLATFVVAAAAAAGPSDDAGGKVAVGVLRIHTYSSLLGRGIGLQGEFQRPSARDGVGGGGL